LDDFQPVSIKMAKTQNLSLNPTKISGTCGRLMCCLKYEQEAYEDLIRRSPKEESFVDTPEGRGTVVEINLLRQQVKVRLENEPETVHVFSNEDIAVFRNGKAKKTDALIPDDWAPISGNGKRVRREQPEQPRFLDPIRFRYSEESVTEDVPEEEPIVAEEPAQENKSRSRRRNKNRGKAEKAEQPKEEVKAEEPKAEKPKQKPQKQPKPKQEAAPVQQSAEKGEAEAGADKPKHRRPHHRRHYRKPGKPAAE
jgi:hypothetical protein